VRYELSDKLVVGVASSALFDLAESDEVFRLQGTEAYRRYQRAHLEVPFALGVAFPFIKRLLSLNDLSPDGTPLVEVIVLSRNSPDTGERVLRSIRHHGLAVDRAIFTEGLSPYRYMGDLNMSLFLSSNAGDVAEAIGSGLPAGRVLQSAYRERDDRNLLIAFDFDGVLADDSSERVMRAEGLARFIAHETERAIEPLSPGPLRNFLEAINKLQRIEEEHLAREPAYQVRVRVSIVTARSAPAYERAMASLRSWGVTVNDAFFLGGVDKAAILRTLQPDIYFDDQISHVEVTALTTPSVHVPFGIANVVPAQRVAPSIPHRT
jgi:5'-nucleotidase